MLDKLVSPFVGYWYWAQDRETPLARGAAMVAPLLVAGAVLYFLFLSGGGGSSFTANLTPTTQNSAAVSPTAPLGGATTPAGATGVAPGVTQSLPQATQSVDSTVGPAPTAFTQIRYTVVPGDAPSVIAEKVGVPVDIRNAWIEEMLALNGVSATTLQVGQELILPPF